MLRRSQSPEFRAPPAYGLLERLPEPPGQEVTLFEAEEPSGIIRKIVVEGDGSPEFFQESWIRMRWDGHRRWFDLDFDIPPALTRGKSALDVKLEADASDGRGEFADFEYEVYCFKHD